MSFLDIHVLNTLPFYQNSQSFMVYHKCPSLEFFMSSRKSKFNHEYCNNHRSEVVSGLRLDTLRRVKFVQKTHPTPLLRQLNTHFQSWSIRQQHSLTRINLTLLCFCLWRSRFFLPLMIKRCCWASVGRASSPFFGLDQWQRRFSWRSLSSSPHVLLSYWATRQWGSLIICSRLDLPFLPMSHVRVLLFLAHVNGKRPSIIIRREGFVVICSCQCCQGKIPFASKHLEICLGVVTSKLSYNYLRGNVQAFTNSLIRFFLLAF